MGCRVISAEQAMRQVLAPKRRGQRETPGAVPTAALRFKRFAGATLLQQAWRHPGGTEWRTVPMVPEQAPDWEDGDAASPPVG
jgi:hypothetical protein